MKKILLISFLLISQILAKEVKINLDEAISLALENNGLNKISKINLENFKEVLYMLDIQDFDFNQLNQLKNYKVI